MKCRYGPAVLASWLMWLFLSLKLPMLCWPNLYSMNSLQLLFTLFEVLNDAFYPVVLDGPVSQHEVQLFAQPARFSGLGIGYPVGIASWAFSLS